jgi:toxin CcdB
MAEFALHALRGDGGLVVDVQSDLLDDFGTRVVVPLIDLAHAPQAPRRLNPIFEVGGRPMILATHLLAAMPRSALGQPLDSLAARRDAIRDALDMLFLGF